MGMNNVIKPAFSDDRVRELHEKIVDTVYDYTRENNMPTAAVIGTLEMVKLNMHLATQESDE